MYLPLELTTPPLHIAAYSAYLPLYAAGSCYLLFCSWGRFASTRNGRTQLRELIRLALSLSICACTVGCLRFWGCRCVWQLLVGSRLQNCLRLRARFLGRLLLSIIVCVFLTALLHKVLRQVLHHLVLGERPWRQDSDNETPARREACAGKRKQKTSQRENEKDRER